MTPRGAAALALALAAPVLLSGCGGDNPRTVLQAFDAADGRPLWTVALGAREGATEPVIVGDTVFVRSAAYGLADGRFRYHVPKAGELPAAVTDDLAVFSLDHGRIQARRADTGEVTWTRETPGQLVQSHASGPIALVLDPDAVRPSCAPAPLPGEPPVCTVEVGPPPGPGSRPPIPHGTVALLDPRTGTAAWTATLPGRVQAFHSAVSSRYVFAGYATDYSDAMTVAALRVADGRTAWSAPARSLSHVVSADGIPALQFSGDTDRAVALDPETGEQLWETSGFAGPTRRWPFLQAGLGSGYGARRDPRTGADLPGRVPATYGVAASGDVLVGAAGGTLTAVLGAERAWTARLPVGARPITYLDVDDEVVVAVTSVGQERYRD